MGQNSSRQRDPHEASHHHSPRLLNVFGGRHPRFSIEGSPARQDRPQSTSAARSTLTERSLSARPFASFTRQISSQTIPILQRRSTRDQDVSTRDDVFYEQHEHRPLTVMDDPGIQSTPITHITASPMPRSSRLSRASSYLMSRHSRDEHLDSRGEGYNAYHSARRALPIQAGSVGGDENHSHRSSVLSPLTFASLTPRSRRRREIAPISPPLPILNDTASLPSALLSGSSGFGLLNRDLPTSPDTRASGFFTTPLSTRLSQMRRSITNQLDILGPVANNNTYLGLSDQPLSPPQRTSSDNPNYLLPPVNLSDTATSLNAAVLDAANRDPGAFEIATVSESPDRGVIQTAEPSWTERLTDRGSAGRRETRRTTSGLRARPGRLVRRDNEGPLPRILSLAASTIAAQLSGSPDQAVPSMQAAGSDDLNGSLQNLFRAVQHATTLVEEDHARGNAHDNTPASSTQPLNFLRVFRFVSRSTNSTPPTETSIVEVPRLNELGGPQPSAISSNDEYDGRTVTLVVVGVRAVPPDNMHVERSRQEDMSASSPAVDSVHELPPLAQNMNIVRTHTGGFLRHTSLRSRLPHRRRASIGGLGSFPAQYDSQRHHRTLSSSNLSSGIATPNPGTSTPPFLTDSPPGPRPPPSTPADHALSAVSSQATTPSRRMSTASALQYPPVFDRDMTTQIPRPEDGIVAEDRPHRFVQQRRRSDSESARHRNFGAGASRRNGVVEPDDVETDNVPATRSWLIYVVGTNLSEDHPALTTPSLFTDVRYILESCFGTRCPDFDTLESYL